jgi:hypothetical protein
MGDTKYISLCVLSLAACYAPPASDERFQESVVVTAHDETADFQKFQTFYVRPDVRVVDETPDGMMAPEMLPDVVAKPLVDATQQNLIQRGFRPVDSKDDADLAVEIAYLRAIYSASYCYDWYYWWDYAYWGYYYYYPYNSCDLAVWRSGMMVTHMTDLMSAGPVTPPPIAMPLPSDGAGSAVVPSTSAVPVPGAVLRPGIWFSGIYGVELDSASYVAARTIDGIDQSFEQSPYITSSAAP